MNHVEASGLAAIQSDKGGTTTIRSSQLLNNSMTKMLPFNVGQIIEARSFQEGYRGAWFRCKIRDISNKKNVTRYSLEYLDFPDERIHSTKIYQKFQVKDKHLKGKRHLMVRPKFPHVCRESQVIDNSGVLEAVVAVNDVWKVGDLVDWWSDGCYWSGTLLKEVGDEKFQLELFPAPIGEGGCYVVSSNDLRPSLDYSPNNGWTVPFSQDGDKGHRCARLIKLVKEGIFDSLTAENLQENEQKIQPEEVPASVYQRASSPSLQNSPRRTATKSKRGCDVSKCGTEEEEDDDDDDDDTGGALKKLKTDEESILLNTMMSSTVEAAVVDLEELVSRIKWLKGMLKCFPETAKSSWVFVEYRQSATPR